METTTMTPTKSMKDWLCWIAAGGLIERTSVSAPVAVHSPKRIGWEMLDKLEAGGWIVWSELYNAGRKYRIMKCKVLLTEAGETIASGRASSQTTKA
ncbi:hypothetical protein [Chromobacterium haemolyticum]|uniref:hypothetical protein n=1 Tax=Chromobacterium haemolyticum TaxID=394935 RepID=UPI002446F7EC|nr:hypothetical protein [Chromobacterium haemolyticum]MDH0342116.1 hypothetical protein [Chromobacterium haemolyticum]